MYIYTISCSQGLYEIHYSEMFPLLVSRVAAPPPLNCDFYFSFLFEMIQNCQSLHRALDCELGMVRTGNELLKTLWFAQ